MHAEPLPGFSPTNPPPPVLADSCLVRDKLSVDRISRLPNPPFGGLLKFTGKIHFRNVLLAMSDFMAGVRGRTACLCTARTVHGLKRCPRLQLRVCSNSPFDVSHE